MSMFLLTDKEIKEKNFINPFEQKLNPHGLSFGLSSMGYDVRLSCSAIKIFKPKNIFDKFFEHFSIFNHFTSIDVKNFNEKYLKQPKIYQCKKTASEYFYIPGGSYALGISFEHFTMPEDILGICMNKSTYARAGIFVNVTPLEPGWRGKLVIEIANLTPHRNRVYLNEGIAQLIFIQSNRPMMTYNDRKGKYQDQIKLQPPISL